MDQLACYRAVIKQILTERADLMRSQPLPGEEVVCLLDDATDNYLLLRLGWVRGKRLYSVTAHLRLVNGQIHVEQDWTDDLVAELVDAGVSREDIAFPVSTPPEMFPPSRLAVA